MNFFNTGRGNYQINKEEHLLYNLFCHITFCLALSELSKNESLMFNLMAYI